MLLLLLVDSERPIWLMFKVSGKGCLFMLFNLSGNSAKTIVRMLLLPCDFSIYLTPITCHNPIMSDDICYYKQTS